ncbi:MAG: flagellar motor protein MotB, partial [Pseudomonadota bacterium]
MSGENTRPLIIKKKKIVGGDGHHGGAWKVAYADFVTAMMAFFMLMWLLNATTEKQRKGLADYFSPTVALSRTSGGGDGAFGGRSMTSDASLVELGRGGITTTTNHGTTEEEDAKLEAAEAALLGKGGESLLDEAQLRHVAVRLTDQGLIVELFDLPEKPLFKDGTPTPLLRDLIGSIAPVFRDNQQEIAINAFTAAEPVVTRVPRGWDLSTSRAQGTRQILPSLGISDAR